MEKSALHEAIDGATGKAHYFPNRMHVNWFPVESTALADGGRRTADGRRERRVSTGRLAMDMMERGRQLPDIRLERDRLSRSLGNSMKLRKE